MPATEQTWRNQKRLHQIFAASGVLLLAATVWMFVQDNARRWKEYQQQFRGVELTVNNWRQDEAEIMIAERHGELESDLLAARSQAISRDLIESFQEEVQQDAVRRGVSAYDFSKVNRLASALEEEAEQAAKAASVLQSAEEVLAKAQETQAAVAVAADSGEAAASNVTSEEAATPTDVQTLAEDLREKQMVAAKTRSQLIESLTAIINAARFREDLALGNRKFKSADLDAAKAQEGLGVRDELGPEKMEPLKKRIEILSAELGVLTLEYQAASAHRKELQSLVKEMTAPVDAAQKDVADNEAALTALQTAAKQRRSTFFTPGFPPGLGKKWLELPILDAFMSPNKVENLWVDGLTINYNFKDVRRFDRCTTCHQAMEKSEPGQANVPAYRAEQLVTLVLQTPELEDLPQNLPEKKIDERLAEVYGLRLAEAGLIDRNAVTIKSVAQGNRGAKALRTDSGLSEVVLGEEIRQKLLSGQIDSGVSGDPGLRSGDVIVSINDNMVQTPAQVHRLLLETVDWGKPVEVMVRRGLPNPYVTHPRLDLFIGSMSPHKMADFACTICHEGQGSATAFKWASHAPNNERDRLRWSREHGWFDNHHWIYPMNPRRFLESGCLKCHHEVVELEPSDRFPEAPAPKLVEGYHLIRKHGCFGCHEIKGYATATKRNGPDMRIEPNFFAVGLQLQALLEESQSGEDDANSLAEEVAGLSAALVKNPDDANLRNELRQMLVNDQEAKEQALPEEVHKLADMLKDVETPGDYRKVGPSLRYVGSKLEEGFLYDWIRDPRNFRASTRMPKFFGLWSHLHGESLELAKENEPLEILAISRYLLDYSQPFEYAEPPEGAEAGDAEEQLARGRELFETRGCLACHTHADFPEAKEFSNPKFIMPGPDLTGLAGKFNNPKGKKWLYSWLRDPQKYHSRSIMPYMFLEAKEDAAGNITDPIADIVEFLTAGPGSSAAYQPVAPPKLGEEELKVLDRLVLSHLEGSFYTTRAQEYLKTGIPQQLKASLKGAEMELLGQASGEELLSRKLRYLGRKSISKWGCYGCHDIPGFEDAKPIGTGLADWGRKDPSKIAFEHIHQYLHHGGHSPQPEQGMSQEDFGYYMQQLDSHSRNGFIFQKLREPRSFDFETTENKGYHDRLRMPEFNFTPEEREAVITFVLGLVAEPPADKFVYRPNERSAALLAGKQVLDKFNCGGCHVLSLDKWDIAYDQEWFEPQPEIKVYPFIEKHYSPQEVEQALATDRQGLLTAHLAGLPTIDANALPMVNDYEGDPIEDDEEYSYSELQFPFDLWEPTILGGHTYQSGVLPVSVDATMLSHRQKGKGGMLARYLLPRVTAAEKEVNASAKGEESWAWVPPPLIGQGKKVQTDWLHDFLLDPHMIRPAVVLRMPRFNMSSEEATALVNYFAAVDNAEYPYEFSDRRRSSNLAEKEAAYRQQNGDENGEQSPSQQQRLNDAMNIVVNGNYCIKCHIVGDFVPKGSERALAPDLAEVYKRLRPDYVREWIAYPKSKLPYTAMPVNIPYDPDAEHLGGVSQELYHGTSVEQLDGLVDLLMNFDDFARKQTLVAPLVEAANPPMEEGAEPGEEAAEGENTSPAAAAVPAESTPSP